MTSHTGMDQEEQFPFWHVTKKRKTCVHMLESLLSIFLIGMEREREANKGEKEGGATRGKQES